ncbi:MAG: hypothetical protein AAF615_00340 [Pseudomonadota bacterium]
MFFDPTTSDLEVDGVPINILLNGDNSLRFVGDASNDGVTILVRTVTTNGFEPFFNFRDGNDFVSIDGVRFNGTIIGGGGNDTLVAENTTSGTTIVESPNGIAFDGAAGDDVIEVGRFGGTPMVDGLLGGGGDDTFHLASGTVDGRGVQNGVAVNGQDGDDNIAIQNGMRVLGSVVGGSGNDTITNHGRLEDFTRNSDGRFAQGGITGGSGDDLIRNSGVIFGTIFGGSGDDTIVNTGRVRVARTNPNPTVPNGDLVGGSGDDFILNSGTVEGGIFTGTGNDRARMVGGTVGEVNGDAGTDRLEYFGGNITGAINDFERILIEERGTDQITANSIDISGDDVFVGLRNTNLLDGAGNPTTRFQTRGVDVFRAQNAQFALDGIQAIQELRVLDGSTLRVDGAVELRDAGRLGTLNLDRSVLDAADGDTDDSLRVGAVRMVDARVQLDVDPDTNTADTLIVDPRISNRRIDSSFGGRNFMAVSFLSTPGDELEVTVAQVFDDTEVEFLQQALSTFNVEGVGAGYNPMRALTLVADRDGNVVLTTRDREIVAVATSPSNAGSAEQLADDVTDLADDLADDATGFGEREGGRQITPTFGVFSTGSFGRSLHDGYTVRGAGVTTRSASFERSGFSLIATGELDASAELGLEDIGLRFSAFGGYVQSHVDLDQENQPFKSTGFNEGGMFGASVLVSRIVGLGNLYYGLGSAAGSLGTTKVTNGDTGARGNYGTQGFLLAAKVGRNTAISDRVFFDARVGGKFVYFHGNSFTDSSGARFGSSETTYGAVSFEPGLSTAFLAGEARVSPSVRLLLEQRIGYRNEASANDIAFTFSDGDFTVGGEIAATVDMNNRLSAGIAVQGRVSEDQKSLLGKLSLNYRFGGGT